MPGPVYGRKWSFDYMCVRSLGLAPCDCGLWFAYKIVVISLVNLGQLIAGLELHMRLKVRQVKSGFASLICLVFAALFWGQNSWSKQCSKVYRASFEVSTEVEIPVDEGSVFLLNTPNELVSGLYDNIGQIPSWLSDEISTNPNLASVPLADLKFTRLPYNTRVRLIKDAMSKRQFGSFLGMSSLGHRQIGKIIADPVLQEIYGMRRAVDIASLETAKTGEMVEVHLRSKEPPSQMILKTRRLYQETGRNTGHYHLHLVIDLPTTWLMQDRRLNALRLSEHWRRMNVFFEMRDMVEKGSAILDNKTAATSFFSPMDLFGFRGVFSYLGNIAASPLGSRSKMAWVGFWGHDKYDGNGLMGYEFRFLNDKDNQENLLQFLDHLPEKIEAKDFGISADDLQLWVKKVAQDSQMIDANYDGVSNKTIFQALFNPKNVDMFPAKFFKALSPNQDIADLIKSADPELVNLILASRKSSASDPTQDFAKRGRLRYLIYNWHNDPILFQRPELLQRIKQKQLQAIRRWARGEDEKQIAKDFLISSGIYQEFAQSLGFSL